MIITLRRPTISVSFLPLAALMCVAASLLARPALANPYPLDLTVAVQRASKASSRR